MKIALFLPDLRGGGVERMTLRLAGYFQDNGHAVDFLLVRARGELLNRVPSGCRVIDFDADRLRGSFRPLVRYLNNEQPDALLARLWPLTSLAVCAGAWSQTDCRIVVSEHNTASLTPLYRNPINRWLMRITIALSHRLADGVVAVSRGVAEDLAKVAFLPSSRVTVIHNPAAPTNAEMMESAQAGPCPHWPRDKRLRRIVAIGSLKEQKDYPTLLRSFAEVRVQEPAHLLILGDGRERRHLEGLVASLGLDGDVTLPGFIQDPMPCLTSADLFVLSSATEGFGNVIVEALSCGVPVVSTNCRSGPREILRNGRYGRLVPVGDHAAMSAAILEELQEPGIPAESLRRRASDFSVEVIGAEYLHILAGAGHANHV